MIRNGQIWLKEDNLDVKKRAKTRLTVIPTPQTSENQSQVDPKVVDYALRVRILQKIISLSNWGTKWSWISIEKEADILFYLECYSNNSYEIPLDDEYNTLYGTLYIDEFIDQAEAVEIEVSLSMVGLMDSCSVTENSGKRDFIDYDYLDISCLSWSSLSSPWYLPLDAGL